MTNYQSIKRRTILKQACATGLGILGFPMINRGRAAVAATGNGVYSVRAVELVEQSFNIDLKHALDLYPKTVESYLTDPDTFTEKCGWSFVIPV